jgi:hypothetical protein
MAFDAAELTAEVRKLAARHEQLHERLSRVTGPVAGYEEMTLPQLAAYGLEKLGIEPPDADDDPSVVALEFALRGRGGQSGLGAGMDAGGLPSFLDRYLNGT